ncbi:cation:proton antiporter [Marinomonas algicola]|uniref:cation:proton antiporter n=1 Tax=Marinomonas algicola TaxID=2773454 RepID=UPI00174C1B24|nr:cation:proton antiporter [Marinomonas algicola]
MLYTVLAVVSGLFLLYSISIRPLSKKDITGPMFFVVGGILIACFLPNKSTHLEGGLDYVLPLIEMTLSVFLFTDAAKSKLSVLKHSIQYPSLLLFVALPLTLLLGIATALLLFADLTLLQAALIAIILTPTDAALSKGLLENLSVPARIREGINTESGLNDGLCVPLFLIFSLLANSPETTLGYVDVTIIFVRELGVAVIIALVSTFAFIALMRFAMTHRYFAHHSSPYLLLGFAVLVFSLAQALHSSGFIAAFVAGLLFDKFAPKHLSKPLIKDSEHIADFISLLIWCLFGFVVAYAVIPEINLRIVIYALLSTTLIRMIPVMLSLSFTALNLKERLTFAWFGPRGLASIVFTLMVIDTQIEGKSLIATIAMTTILFSVFIHGVSTKPIADSFSDK